MVRFDFERPIQAFEFAPESDEAEELRERTWKITSPGVARENATIRASNGEPFTSFEAEVEASNEPTDATYPCVFKVGPDGIGIYAGYFVGDEAQFATTLEVKPTGDQVTLGLPMGGNVWRVDPAFHQNAGHRYIYVGPDRASESNHARFVIPADTLPDLAARIRSDIDAAIAYYTQKTGRSLALKPLVLLAANPATDRAGLQGDTTAGPTVALRLFGKNWEAKFAAKPDTFDHLIMHEAAHFWNSDSFHAAAGSPSWLWEGGAQYWAITARAAILHMPPEERRAHVEGALNDCAVALRKDALGGRRTNATYACGETVQWLADVFERTRTRGRHDVFSVWRRIFDKADSSGGVYSTADFINSAVAHDKAANDALALFLTEEGIDRWSKLPARLKPFGVALALGPPSDEALRTTAVWHMLNLACEGQRGMWHAADHLTLDTGDRCGPLSGDPEVDAINGHNLFTDAPAAYGAVKTACESNGTVSFSRPGATQQWTVPCTAPVPPVPPGFRIAAGG